jgi:hypothetical protein
MNIASSSGWAMRTMILLALRVEGTGRLGVISEEVRSHIDSGIRGVMARRRKSVDVEAMAALIELVADEFGGGGGGEHARTVVECCLVLEGV